MLTPEQMEEAVEAAMEATHHAMPVIERAVLGKAAEAAERVGRPVGAGDGDTYIPGTSADAARAILALAGEVR